MKRKAWIQLLSLLLSVMMVVSCLPLTVFAADGDGGPQAGTAYAPADAEAAGYDVHYFVKAAGNGWTISDDKGYVTLKDTDNVDLTVPVGSGGQYRIWSGKYCGSFTAVSDATGSNAKITGDFSSAATNNTAFNFTFTAVEDDHPNAFTIKEPADLYLTSTTGAYTQKGTTAWTGVEFGDTAQVFYVTPVNAEAFDGQCYIWYATKEATEPDTSIVFRDPADCREGYEPAYFTKYGGANGNGWTFDAAQDNAAMTFTVDGQAVASLDTDTEFKISFNGKYLVAPFTNAGLGATDSTAQGGSSDSLFKLVPGKNGGHLLQAVGTDKYMTSDAADFPNWKGVKFAAEGTEFFISPVSAGASDGRYYIWYEAEKTTEPSETEQPTPPDEEKIEHHQPTEGMTQRYLDFLGAGWGGTATKSALELYNVADGSYSKDTDGVINSGVYGIYDPTPGDGGSKRWMHAGTGTTNQCGANTCGAPHQFTFTYDAEKKAYTIQSVSTGSYLTQTVSGSQLAMNGTPTYFYIDPVEGAAGSYYIWWETESRPGDDISDMFDLSPDNTWVFTGGADVEGGWAQTRGHRNFMGQFEEYIRWQQARSSGTNENSATGFNEPRQRYTINTAQAGLTLSAIVAGWDTYVEAYDPRAVVYMVGQEDAGSQTFAQDLTSFINNSLALRDNEGFAVIIKSYDSSLNGLNETVDPVVNGLKGDASKYARIVVVEPTGITGMDAGGHLELGRQLCLATFGSAGNYPCDQPVKEFAEKAAPSSYSATAPAVAWTGDDMTITLSGSFTYEVRLDSGVTVSGSGTGTAAVTGLPNGEVYTLITCSSDGKTQYETLTGKVGGAAYQPELTDAQKQIAALVAGEKPLTWLFMGDSITHGAMWTSGYDSVSQTFDKYLDMLGRPDDVVINTAVSSADTRSTLNAIDYRLNQYPAPDVVAIMLGTNDQSTGMTAGTTYKENLTRIIAAIRAKNPDAVIILRAPTGNYGNSTDRKAHRDAMEQFARENGLTFIDQWTQFVEYAQARPWTNPSYGPLFYGNALHPGALGQLMMAKMFIQAIGLWDEDTPIANLDYEWPGMITEDSATSVSAGLTSDQNTLTLTVSQMGSSLGETTLTATNAAGQSWSVTAKAGEAPKLTDLPDGTYTVTASSVKTDMAKTVNFAAAEITLPETTVPAKMPAPPVLTTYEYVKASGAFTEGTYAIVGTTLAADDGPATRIRVMHLWYNAYNVLTVDHCQINAGDVPGGETLTVDHEDHLVDAKAVEGGYVFQVSAGNAKGKYLTGDGSTLSLSDTATVFTVAPMEDGGYSMSWNSGGTTYYVAFGSNFRTGSDAPYKLNLYRQTEVEPDMAQTEFSGTSTDGPLVRNDTGSYFRIPSLYTLDNGWIMASSDIRWCGTGDNPSNIDTIVSISKDDGKTWEWEVMNYFADHATTSSNSSSTAFIDPAFVQASDGTVWMAVDATPAYGGNMGGNRMIPVSSDANKGFDAQGRMLVGHITDVTGSAYQPQNGIYTYDYYADLYGTDDLDTNDGAVYTVNGDTITLYPICAQNGDWHTGYYVDAFANTYYDYGKDGEVEMKPVLAQQMGSSKLIHNNLFYLQSEWKVPCTFYLMVRSAIITEDGLEWSDPVFANVKNLASESDRSGVPNERFTGICPGRGTVVELTGEDGQKFERIIFPLYDNASNEVASVMYSDDGGATWLRGGHADQLNGSGKSSESQIVILPNGDLRMYSRNTVNYLYYTDSTDGGITWGPYTKDEALYSRNPGNGCMMSFINVEGYVIGPDNEVYTNLIMASYPYYQRNLGVIRIGYMDENEPGYPVHWLDSEDYRLTQNNSFVYSCLTQLRNADGSYRNEVSILPELDLSDNTGIPYLPIDFDELLGEGWYFVMEVPEIPVVTASTDLVDLDVGETVTVTAETSVGTLVWASGDESVATVDGGVITAVAPGKTVVTVTATNSGVTRKAVIEVVVQDGESVIVPDKFADEVDVTITQESKTQYELADESALPDGVYAIFSLGNGARVMYNNTSKTDHCMASPSNGVLTSISCHTTNLHLWRITRQADGTYTIQGVSNGKYLTSAANGGQLSLGDTATPFTIAHQGDGVYHVSSEGSYLSWNSGWKMQSSGFSIQFYAETNYEAIYSYSACADGLKALMAELEIAETEEPYASAIAGAKAYETRDEADEAQQIIDELAQALYAELRRPDAPVDPDPSESPDPSETPDPSEPPEPSETPDPIEPSEPPVLPVVPEIVIPDDEEEIEDPDAPLASLPFIDVDHEKWYAQSIANVVAKGLMEGTSELLFAPEDAMTRGMMAQALYALAQKPEIEDPASFLDLADGVSYADAVAWGAANGVIKGYNEDEFGGEDALNRQQLATLLYRYAQIVEERDVEADVSVLEQFSDADRVSAWAKEAMAWAVAEELVIGRTDGTLDPRAEITRAEAAAILDRYSKLNLA